MPLPSRVVGLIFCLVLAVPGAALAAHHELAEGEKPAKGRGRCADYRLEKRALFGELHVHTGASMDANLFGTRLRPADAYRFAKGESVAIPSLGSAPASEIRIGRPLDFAAVTDHASGFGTVRLCRTPGSPSYDSEGCKTYRNPIELGGAGVNLRAVIRQLGERLGTDIASRSICGEDGAKCAVAMGEVWQEMQEAAAEHNDDSDECNFTTFVAYEYTLTPELTKIHRNVIFRGDKVLPLPISAAEEPSPIELWKRLRKECIEAGTGCDVLAIPHNSNLSNGHMFAVEYGDAKTKAEEAEIAKLRAEMEPVVEMMQMKGDSECRNDLWKVLGGRDEFCDFEKLRPVETEDCKDRTGKGALGGDGCVSRLDFARYALIEGLREAERIGVNPYEFGMIAATDGHDGVAGAVEEPRLDLRMGRVNPQPGMNLGGLAGVWAEENSRDAIFDALRRRETFGTSGPRMQVRMFGGWNYPQNLCERSDLVARGYMDGVPMGGELERSSRSRGSKPTFVVSALADPGSATYPGTPLQRIQIIKGWAGADGTMHQRVVDVVGATSPQVSVDTETCEPKAPQSLRHESLCAVWSDPNFDPKKRAVYYARVVENPSCSTTGWACSQMEAAKRPAFCSDASQLTTQERAWTSPIWYTP